MNCSTRNYEDSFTAAGVKRRPFPPHGLLIRCARPRHGLLDDGRSRVCDRVRWKLAAGGTAARPWNRSCRSMFTQR
jgi:hypothetical protein